MIAAIFVFAAILVGAFVLIGVAMRRATESALGKATGPEANAAKDAAREKAEEVKHAPDDDIAARIDQLRERGRSGH